MPALSSNKTTAGRIYDLFRYPYVGIIQIRLSVEGPTFLSACNTSSRLFNLPIYYTAILCKRKALILYIYSSAHLTATFITLSFLPSNKAYASSIFSSG